MVQPYLEGEGANRLTEHYIWRAIEQAIRIAMINDKRIRKIFAFANNHYAGHGPPTIKSFWELWSRK